MNNDKLIHLSIGGKAYFLNPVHFVALLPGSPSSKEVRLYLTKDALDCLPKENPGDKWVTLYDDEATELLRRFGLQLEIH